MVPVVLGLDQSFAAIGHAVVAGMNPAVLTSGVLKTARGLAIDKLPEILRGVGNLMSETEGTLPSYDYALALEQSWLGENFQTASKLAELRGALVGLALGRGWDVHRVEPRTWHASAGIPIRSDRKTVKRSSIVIANMRANAKRTIISDDEADAINIAWHVAGVLRMKGASAA